MKINEQSVSVLKSRLDNYYPESDLNPDGHVLEITFLIPAKLAKEFCTRSRDDMMMNSAMHTAAAEDAAHARYGGMMRIITAGRAERWSEEDEAKLMDRSGFTDMQRDERIQAGVERRMIDSGVYEIKRRIIHHFGKEYPVIPSGFTAQGNLFYQAGIQIPVKPAPGKVLDLAEILKEKGTLQQAVTLEEAYAKTETKAAPVSRSFHELLIALNEEILSAAPVKQATPKGRF